MCESLYIEEYKVHIVSYTRVRSIIFAHKYIYSIIHKVVSFSRAFLLLLKTRPVTRLNCCPFPLAEGARVYP